MQLTLTTGLTDHALLQREVKRARDVQCAPQTYESLRCSNAGSLHKPCLPLVDIPHTSLRLTNPFCVSYLFIEHLKNESADCGDMLAIKLLF